jgi:hypothetical protein
MLVSPAKAGVQFEAFKRKDPPNNDVWTIMDSLVKLETDLFQGKESDCVRF